LSTEERFWSKVDKSGDCWIWTAGPRFYHKGKNTAPYKMAWFLVNGEWPTIQQLWRECGERLCVNPDHQTSTHPSQWPDALAARFWARVEKTDNCWLWKGPFNKKGYGRIQLEKNGKPKWYRAARLSWSMVNGEIPKGLIVRHLICDNPPCVNPAHLALGTHQENMADRRRKTLSQV